MSNPNMSAEINEAVDIFASESGEYGIAHRLREELDNEADRSWLYEEFMEWLDAMSIKHQYG